MEMGRRDVRRGEGTNLFSNKLSRMSKKGLKKLGLADADENMNHKKQEKMMCYKRPASDLETDVSSTKKKKSKLPNKDTNGVDHHASVPRKLRSAMKKRNLESVKKENKKMDAKSIVPESITKDEKEVAETLYGLADMFTDINSIDNKSCDPFLSDGKETNKVDSVLVVEPDFTTKSESLEPVTSFLSSPKPKQIDEEPLQQQDHNQCSLTGLKQSSSVNAQTVSTKPTQLDLLSSSKLPHWMMSQAVSPTKNTSLLSEPLRVRPRKLKKCASHIYICRLIKALQTSKSSPVALLLNQTEERSLELSQCSLPDPVTTISDFTAPSKSYQNPHLVDLHKTQDPKPVQENMTQLGLELYAPPHTTQKQNHDFLSLSSSGAPQSHLPFPNSFPQNHISAYYSSQLSPAPSSHQLMSPYLASRFQTAYNANQQQQLHKRLWAAQYRPPRSKNTVPPSSNQYSNPNLSLNLTSIQPLHIASSPRYINNVSQQPRRVMAAAAAMSMSQHHNHNHLRTVMNRQEHHFPLIYEDKRTLLQLLCSEQL